METTPRTKGEQHYEPRPAENPETGIWKAWDAVPDDGPAVFVLDTKLLDEQTRLHGGWIRFDLRGPDFTRQLKQLLGRTPEAESWAIVDQSQCGPIMVPETFDPAELDTIRDELSEASG